MRKGKMKETLEGRELFEKIQLNKQLVDKQTIDEEFKLLMKNIDAQKGSQRLNFKSIFFAYRKYAAILISAILLLGSVYVLSNKKYYDLYTNNSTKIQKITLKDNSEITLNQNGKVKVLKNWKNFKAREVILLAGEAYFKIEKNTEVSPFMVFVDDVIVKVTGTEFNVQLEENNISVVVQEGSVDVDFYLNSMNKKLTKSLVSGDMFNFKHKGENVIYGVEKVKLVNYISWKESELKLNSASLKDVSFIIEKNYNYKVVIKDSLQYKEISGIIPNDDIDNLLKALEIIFDINTDINKNSKIIVLSSK